jgi:hypothetical protein
LPITCNKKFTSAARRITAGLGAEKKERKKKFMMNLTEQNSKPRHIQIFVKAEENMHNFMTHNFTRSWQTIC